MPIYYGNYEILEEIGNGRSATVYRARSSNPGQDVALKLIRYDSRSETEGLKRFQKEAALIARLSHPHLLPVYDYDGAHDPPYMVMRYLEGTTLAEVLKKEMLPLTEVCLLIQQVASALDYVHGQGSIHCDLKPGNILIDQQGNVFVSDLGLANMTIGSVMTWKDVKLIRALIGTPEYMSPEQALASPALDARTDVYALGAILFEMLTGFVPYPAESSAGVLLRHIQDDIPLLSDFQSYLPDGLQPIINRALAKNPADRYPSAGELADDLNRISGDTHPQTPDRLRAAAARSTLNRSQERARPASYSGSSAAESSTKNHRQATVVHINAADFREILQENAAGKTAEVMNDLWTGIHRIIERSGGFIQEYTGITMQALWGVYESSESDPENAVNAALAIRELARKTILPWLSDSAGVPLRIGVDTGQVSIQSTIGGFSISGQPILSAIQIEQAAPSGFILITHDTFRHVIGIYDAAQEAPVQVQNRTAPVIVYSVQQSRPRAFRLQSRGVEGVETRMIGRETELKVLQDTLQRCMYEQVAQIVTITGPAGIGKSRLVFEFSRWLDVIDQTALFFEGRAARHNARQPYSLLRSLFAFRFEILDSDSQKVMREKFLRGISGFMGDPPTEEAAFIAQLIGFDFSDHPAVKPVLTSPEAFQRQALDHLKQLIVRLTQSLPVVIQLEDIHWADAHSLQFIEEMLSAHRNRPVMILSTARPEIAERHPGWGSAPDIHQRIELHPLNSMTSRRLVREVLQKVELIAPAVSDLIVEQAGGSPLHVEELIKFLIEEGVIVKGKTEEGSWQTRTEHLDRLQVPDGLRGVLNARLRRLEPTARLLLARAAVIGFPFWTSALIWLESADGFHIERLSRLLENLRDHELINTREKSTYEDTAEFVIWHDSLRETIVSGLIDCQRRAYHQAAAKWLIKSSTERLNEKFSEIAYHFEQAGEQALAGEYLLKAAEQAARVAANSEAEFLLGWALDILPDDSDESQRLRVKASLRLADFLEDAGRISEAMNLLEPALETARLLQDKADVARALAYIGRIVGLRRGQFQEAEHLLQEAEPLAWEAGDAPTLIFVLRQMGNLYLNRDGKQEQAIRFLNESLNMANQIGDEYNAALALNSMGSAYTTISQNAQAIAAHKEAISISRAIGDRTLLMLATGNLGASLFYQGQYETALRANQEALTLSQFAGMDMITVHGNIAQAFTLLGHPVEVIQHHLHIVLRQALTSGAYTLMVNAIEGYGLLYTREGQYDRALDCLGLVLKSATLKEIEKTRVVNPAVDRIRQHLSEADVHAGLERGAALDVETMAGSLLKGSPEL